MRFKLFFLVLSAFTSISSAQSVTTVHVFNVTDGRELNGSLIQAFDGNFYGTTLEGITGDNTLFRISSAGESAFYVLTGMKEVVPGFALIQGGDGNFYGVNNGYGYIGCFADAQGCGIVYRLSPDGVLTVLYNFQGDTDGAAPLAPLILGNDGQLYGTTTYGGDANLDGTIFKISPDGTYTLLHRFNDPVDGSRPATALVQASDGNFYGVTPQGGANRKGTIFRITSSGDFTLLHTFSGSDGSKPQSRLVEALPGILYGSTILGGDMSRCSSAGCGTIFKMDFPGNVATIFRFEDEEHGSFPQSDLFQASDGNLYSTAGGSSACIAAKYPACFGSIFSVTPAGNLSTLYTSNNLKDSVGATNYGGLLQSSSGDFWGATWYTTDSGQITSYGTIYKFQPASTLPPPIQLSFVKDLVKPNTPATLNWKVVNAASLTMQQCYAFIQNVPAGAGTWTGLQTGTVTGSTMSGSTTITPTEIGTYTYALTCGGIESGFATLTVGPPPLVIKAASLPNGMVGSPYSVALTTTGGYGATTWSISSGNLPPGMTLTANTGILLGIPTEAGTFNFAVKVEDSEDTPATATASLAITIQPAASKIIAQVSPSTITTGQNVTLSANVTGVPGAPIPGGTVQFIANGKNIGSAVSVATGTASLSGAFFTAPGTYSIIAQYSGDASYNSASSASVQLTVAAPVPGISVTVNPSTITAGGSTTLTAQLAGTPAPTGTIQFLANGANIGSPVTLVAAVATLADQVFSTAGTYAITAVYGGDGNYAGTTSSAVTLTVSSIAALLTASPQTITVASPGASGSTTLHLSNFSSDAVKFSCSGLPIASSCSFGHLQGTGMDGTATMVMTTSAAYSAHLDFWGSSGSGVVYAGVLPGILSLAGFFLNRRRYGKGLLLCVILAVAGFATGCGVKVNGTPPGSYPITVTASNGAQTASTIVSLNVEQ